MPIETKPLVIGVALAILWAGEVFVPWIPNRRDRVKHGLNNVGLGAINAVLAGLVFASATVFLTSRAAESGFGLLNLLKSPIWLDALLAVLLLDLWQYLWHRLNHVIPLLWRFHAVHHADRDLDATSAVRFHTVEIFASAIARLAVLPILGARIEHVLLYELFVMPVILLHHSNIRFPEMIDRILRIVIVTPGMHRVHHSQKRDEHDSNYASIFSFWDRLGGSFSGAKSEVVLGLPDMEPRQWSSIWGMLRMPFGPRGR